MSRKALICQKEKKEIFYHIINAGLSGALVLLGSFATTGEIESRGILFAVATAMIVAITKFKEYWDGEKSEFSNHVFNFIG